VTVPHFFVEHLRDVEPGATVALSPEDSRHALRALRLRTGEAVTLADGVGGFARGRIATVAGDATAAGAGGARRRAAAARVEVLELEVRSPASPRIVVTMAAPKGDRMAWATQKLTEVGVDELVLLEDADRAVRAAGDHGAALPERLRRIAREAAMQSRRPFVMDISEAGFEQALEPDEGPLLMLWEGAAEPLRAALEATPSPARVRLLIGPEGSFSEAEVDRAGAAGARLVSMGPGILRTETAALAGAIIALSVYGRLG
jgi:16S rRNA (uracil1498-N3)-methyltransferase